MHSLVVTCGIACTILIPLWTSTVKTAKRVINRTRATSAEATRADQVLPSPVAKEKDLLPVVKEKAVVKEKVVVKEKDPVMNLTKTTIAKDGVALSMKVRDLRLVPKDRVSHRIPAAFLPPLLLQMIHQKQQRVK